RADNFEDLVFMRVRLQETVKLLSNVREKRVVDELDGRGSSFNIEKNAANAGRFQTEAHLRRSRRNKRAGSDCRRRCRCSGESSRLGPETIEWRVSVDRNKDRTSAASLAGRESGRRPPLRSPLRA